MLDAIRMRFNAVRPVKRPGSQNLPAGVLPMAAALLLLVVVPIARAGGEKAQPEFSTSGGAAPSSSDRLAPRILRAELINARALAGGPIRVRLLTAGGVKASARLWVQASGSNRWRPVAEMRVSPGKRTILRWSGGRPGRYMTRVSVESTGKRSVDHTGRAYVFRRSFASYYGPGLYGGGLACGGRLRPGTIGVAHKTLPCGTRVTFTLGRGRVITARVIDRGPYIGGREWDLTAGLKRKLGFGDIGAVYATH